MSKKALTENKPGKNGRKLTPEIVSYLNEANASYSGDISELTSKAGVEHSDYLAALEGESPLSVEDCVNLEKHSKGAFEASKMLNLYDKADPKIVLYIDERCRAWQAEFKEHKGKGTHMSLDGLAKKAGIAYPHIWKSRTGLKVFTIDHCAALEKASGGFFEAEKIRPDHYIDSLNSIGYEKAVTP